MLVKVDLVLKKKGRKQNLIWSGGFSNGKVVFVLLIKVIILYIKPIAINVKGFGLELVPRYSTFLSLEECLNNLV